MVLCCSQINTDLVGSIVDSRYTNGRGCMLTKFYLWAAKFDFISFLHLTKHCDSFDFPPIIKKCEAFLALRPYKNKGHAGLGPGAIVADLR